jgi:hypothetical protein
VRGDLEGLERVHVQGLVNPPRERGPHTGDRPEEPLGIQASANPLELTPAPGPEHLDDRGRDPRPDPRQRLEARGSVALVDLGEVLPQGRDGPGGLAVGADPERARGLLLQQIGRLAESVGDDLVRRGHGGAGAPRPASLTT